DVDPDRLESTLVAAEPALMRVALRLTGSEPDARDLVQTLFERAIRESQFMSTGNAHAWLVANLKNMFKDCVRLGAPGATKELAQDPEPVDEMADEHAWPSESE